MNVLFHTDSFVWDQNGNMEVKNAHTAMLSNYEVFQLLTDLKEQKKDSGKSKHSAGQQNLNTIMYETLKYLSKTPCSRQRPEMVKAFLSTMMRHKLTKAEKLQLLNHRPRTAVEMQLDLFAIGDPARGLNPQTTSLLGLLGHTNPSTTIRWWRRARSVCQRSRSRS
ncbi:DNA-directed RNA polymerase III subunit RPC9 isoform X1 [Phycodurus eques]|uniref:DNA-directed RNA polymerase III subunit RPC9 isoform X1 n=1 Tax=Phycodurus eques TaxID=693459 RepID=UPI002ACF086A|nr:DNA-directed RNA polymerase III subunit RPC9 isoform X1 [Phycodurus eques]